MTELEVYQPRGAVAVPRDIDSWTQIAGQVIKLANEIYDTPFVPDGLRGSVPATAAAILAGRELGLEPLTSLANIHVIKGKPSLSAALMRALILAQGHQIETVDISDTRAVIKGRRRGESTWEEAAFTAEQAKRAGIQLGGYPQDKLYARATSRLARRKFADVIAGMPYSAEELEDIESEETAIPAASNGHAEPAKPAARTAQRRTRAAADRPTTAAPAAASAPTTGPATATAAPSNDGLPPLPGEDEAPEDARALPVTQAEVEAMGEADKAAGRPEPRATTGQVGIIQSHFKRLGFEEHERDERLAITATIAGLPEGRDLGSSKELTQPQALVVADTLSRCKDRAKLMALVTGTSGDSGA